MTPFPKNARVLFTGASTVAHSNFTLRIADYYRKHLPELNVKFFACCEAGGQYLHGIKHFDDMILPFEPTHVVCLYGANDAGLSALNHTDPELKKLRLTQRADAYKENIEIFLGKLREHSIEPILVTACAYGEFLPIDTAAYSGGFARLAEFAEYVRKACIKHNIPYFDVHARTAELFMHEDIFRRDRTHLTDYGEWRVAQYILRCQGLDIGEYVPFEELTKDEWNAAWYKNAYRLSRIYGAYVNLYELELYEKPVDEQMHIVEEYVITRGYGEVNSKRDYSTEFVIFKPQEKTFIDNLRRLNEDEV